MDEPIYDDNKVWANAESTNIYNIHNIHVSALYTISKFTDELVQNASKSMFNAFSLDTRWLCGIWSVNDVLLLSFVQRAKDILRYEHGGQSSSKFNYLS